jgi:hypothetical protein
MVELLVAGRSILNDQINGRTAEIAKLAWGSPGVGNHVTLETPFPVQLTALSPGFPIVPVSIQSNVLPAGAATGARQDLTNVLLANIEDALSNTSLVDGATAANQATAQTTLTNILAGLSPLSGLTLQATAAKQDTGNAVLVTINNALANPLPLSNGAALASNQTDGSQIVQIANLVGDKVGVTSGGLNVNIIGGGGGGGSEAQYQEGAVLTADPVGTALLARRRDTLAAEVTTVGMGVIVNATSKGEVYTKHVDTINVSFNSVAQPVSLSTVAVTNVGTFLVQAAQSGTWDVRNITGTVPLPSGASTSAAQTTAQTSFTSIVNSLAGTIRVASPHFTTATYTSLALTTGDGTLLAANSNRLPGSTIVNDTNQVLYIKLGTGPSTSSYYVALDSRTNQDGTYDATIAPSVFAIPDGYTGVIHGTWGAAGSGNAYITEMT